MDKKIEYEHKAAHLLKEILNLRHITRGYRHGFKNAKRINQRTHIGIVRSFFAEFFQQVAGIGKKVFNILEFIHLYEINTKMNPNLEKPLVFFALHYEPELTTAPMGGNYCDQVLAIEELRRIVPEHVAIYIKDHPNSFGAHRNAQFYMRIKTLNNVEFISSKISSKLLTEKSLFVATITGTVGFEAVCNNKAVLTFGYAWYNGIDGVFSIYNNPTYETIVNHKIKQEKVTEDFGEISLRLGQFYHYWAIDKKHVKHVNRKENTEKFLNFIKGII